MKNHKHIEDVMTPNLDILRKMARNNNVFGHAASACLKNSPTESEARACVHDVRDQLADNPDRAERNVGVETLSAMKSEEIREKITEAVKKVLEGDPQFAEQKGAEDSCRYASERLIGGLKEAGLTGILIGNRHHVWVKVDCWNIDLTARQFDPRLECPLYWTGQRDGASWKVTHVMDKKTELHTDTTAIAEEVDKVININPFDVEFGLEMRGQ